MKNDKSVSSSSYDENILQLKSAIDDGINSGRAENFDPAKYLDSLKAKRDFRKIR